MSVAPLDRFTHDLDRVGAELRHLDEAEDALADELAAAVRDEAPYVSGFLVSTVGVDSEGVVVTAPYAGVVHDSNPYAERAVDRVDAAGVVQGFVDDALARLSPIYA